MADKKKRGESGKKNAETSPFRLNGGGLYPFYMRKIMGVMSGNIGHPLSKTKQKSD